MSHTIGWLHQNNGQWAAKNAKLAIRIDLEYEGMNLNLHCHSHDTSQHRSRSHESECSWVYTHYIGKPIAQELTKQPTIRATNEQRRNKKTWRHRDTIGPTSKKVIGNKENDQRLPSKRHLRMEEMPFPFRSISILNNTCWTDLLDRILLIGKIKRAHIVELASGTVELIVTKKCGVILKFPVIDFHVSARTPEVLPWFLLHAIVRITAAQGCH